MSDKRVVWARRVAAWRSSGESAAGFCRTRGLSHAQFVYWQRVLREAQPGSMGLVPVVVEAAGSADAPIELRLPNGVQARCAKVTDAIALARGWSC